MQVVVYDDANGPARVSDIWVLNGVQYIVYNDTPVATSDHWFTYSYWDGSAGARTQKAQQRTRLVARATGHDSTSVG